MLLPDGKHDAATIRAPGERAAASSRRECAAGERALRRRRCGSLFRRDIETRRRQREIETDAGPAAIVDLGWGFGQGLRAEIEGSYRSNSVSNIDTLRGAGTSQPLADPKATLSTYAVMANVAYDIPLSCPAFPIQPYIGAGVGYGWLDFAGGGGAGFANLSLPGNNGVTGPVTTAFGSAGAFAYQAMVGAAVPLRFLPGLSATIEPTNPINGAIPSQTKQYGFEELDNAILVGLRSSFGGPR
jgi:hypothetical protein